MDKLTRTKTIIEDTLRRERPVCVFFSGGVDSLVLLYLLRGYRLPVVTFMADWSKANVKKLERLVADWDLLLYSFPPKNRYVAAAGGGLSLVDEYGFREIDLPVIRDVEPSDRCLGDLSPQRFESFDCEFGTVFVGALSGDSHALTGATWFREERETETGDVRFVAPLFDWTKKEVEAFADNAGIRDLVIDGTGDVAVCTRCLTGDTFCPAEQREIKGLEWDGDAMRAAFRRKFNFEG